MSNSNYSNSQGIDSLLESIVNLYTDEINAEQSPRQRARTNYPLSFNIQRPRQPSFTQPYVHRNENTSPRPTPTPSPSPTQQSTNQYHSRYLSIIHTLREIGSQYNNNMREYNTNVRQILTIVNDIRQDMQTHRTNLTSPVTSPRASTNIPRMQRQEHARFYDGPFGQQHSARPNQNRSYHRTTETNSNNNIFDLSLIHI